MTYIEFEWNNTKLKIDKMLAESLASLVYNVQEDWDFCVVITGNRLVRTGKSVLAMTCCAFCAYLLKKMKLNENAFNENNIFFDSKQMLDKSQSLTKYSVIQLDEARESLAASKSAMAMQQAVLDFFAECGQLNHIFFLVMPDYFEMKENMAVSRSELLINVYRDNTVVHKDFMGDGVMRPVVMFKRGFFKLYNRDTKAMMYDIYRTTRGKNYNTVKPSFPPGQFENQFPVDEKAYRKLKADALARFKERHEPKVKENKNELKWKNELKLAYQMMIERGIKKSEIAEAMGKNKSCITVFMKPNLFDKKEETGYVDNS